MVMTMRGLGRGGGGANGQCIFPWPEGIVPLPPPERLSSKKEEGNQFNIFAPKPLKVLRGEQKSRTLRARDGIFKILPPPPEL